MLTLANGQLSCSEVGKFMVKHGLPCKHAMALYQARKRDQCAVHGNCRAPPQETFPLDQVATIYKNEHIVQSLRGRHRCIRPNLAQLKDTGSGLRMPGVWPSHTLFARRAASCLTLHIVAECRPQDAPPRTNQRKRFKSSGEKPGSSTTSPPQYEVPSTNTKKAWEMLRNLQYDSCYLLVVERPRPHQVELKYQNGTRVPPGAPRAYRYMGINNHRRRQDGSGLVRQPLSSALR